MKTEKKEKPFAPQILEGKPKGIFKQYLVCANREFRGEKTKTDRPEKTKEGLRLSYEFIAHAVAIDITDGNRKITLGFKDYDTEWEVLRVGEVGLSIKTAQAALKEAYRVSDVKFNIQDMSANVTYNFKAISYKDYSLLWKMVAMIEWETWNKTDKSMEERVACLHSYGFSTVTKKALARTAEKHGV